MLACALRRKQKMPMEAVQTTPLEGGWFKELRKRTKGAQKGTLFTVYTQASTGKSYYSRKQAEAVGMVDPEPDGRTKRANAKAKSKATKKKSRGEACLKEKDA